MSISQPPKTDKPDFDRWLFLFWKLVSAGSATTVVADNTVRPVTIGGTGKSSLTGYIKGNGASPFTAVTTIPYSDISGAPVPASLNAQLTALSNTTGTGLYTITAFGSSATRTLTGTANRLTITNGDGVSGNPTADISTSYAGQATIVTLGTVTTGTWNAGAIVTTNTQNAFGVVNTEAILNISAARTGSANAHAVRIVSALTPTTGNSVYGVTSSITAGSSTEAITYAAAFSAVVTKGGSGTITYGVGYHYPTNSLACTNHYGVLVGAVSGGTSSNYGVFINAPTGTGAVGLYNAGTTTLLGAINGRIGVGSEGPTSDVLMRLVSAPGNTTGVNQYATFNILQLGSDCTGTGFGNYSRVDTNAASFTCGDVAAFVAASTIKGAGSTISRNYGYFCYDQTVGGENYGYYSAVSSGTSKWAFFGAGTAQSYLGGTLKIGGTAARATTAGTNSLDIFNGTAPAGTLTNGITLYSTAGELHVIDAAGNDSLLSPHDKNDNSWIYYSKNTVTGKVLRVDMERLMRALDKSLGGGFITEYTEEVACPTC